MYIIIYFTGPRGGSDHIFRFFLSVEVWEPREGDFIKPSNEVTPTLREQFGIVFMSNWFYR